MGAPTACRTGASWLWQRRYAVRTQGTAFACVKARRRPAWSIPIPHASHPLTRTRWTRELRNRRKCIGLPRQRARCAEYSRRPTRWRQAVPAWNRG